MAARDINELLTNGFFKTSRAKSPSGIPPPTSSNTPSFLRAHEPEHPRARSRSRAPRGPPPPRPFVEDENVSLDRESLDSPRPSYDPPLRGKIDQNPILLEADVTAAEAARLHDIPVKDRDDSGERRFVLIPKSDTYEPNEKDEIVNKKEEIRHANGAKQDAPRAGRQETRPEPVRQESRHQKPSRREDLRDRRPVEVSRKAEKEARPIVHQETPRKEEEPRRRVERTDSGRQEPREEKRESARPGVIRQRSRQDLPTLETKVPREIPPQFRRSASAFGNLQDKDETPKASTPRTTDYFLSPDAVRGKDSPTASRQQVHDLLWGKGGATTTERRRDGSTSRPGTPNSEKRNSGNFESARSSNERMTRSQQLSGDSGAQKDRAPSDRSGRSSRSSTHRDDYSSSEDDIAPESVAERHRKKHHRHRREESAHIRSSTTNGRSHDLRPSSRLSSPLPSPKGSPNRSPRVNDFERTGTFPQTRERRPSSRPVSPNSSDRETPRPDRCYPYEAPSLQKSRQPAGPSSKPPPSHTSSLPIPTPSPMPDSRKSSTQDENRPLGPRPQPQASSWQPPPLQPSSQSLDKPIGSFRRYSEDAESGAIAPLPTCPRMTYTRGRNDWLTLPQCPHFDICPSCFNSIIARTEYSQFFVAAPRRSSDTEVLCDFGSSPWYRIAWLLTVKERRRDLKLFYGLANIANTIQPCLGKREGIRQWHSIVDHKTGGLVRGFDVCMSCVKSVEILLPAVRGVFIRSASHSSPDGLRICDLRFDSKRFVQYFDALETASDRVDYDSTPDTRNLAALAKRLAMFDECQLDTDLLDRRWHIITQLPEFTVCEECFDEVVWPELEEEKAIPMMFNKSLQRLPKASCQLYSAKMRGVFRLASDSGDYKLLASKARERRGRELEYKVGMAELRRRKGEPGVEREMGKVEDEWRRWE